MRKKLFGKKKGQFPHSLDEKLVEK